MHSRIVGKFRMERGRHHLSLPDSHGIATFGRNNFDTNSHRPILGARINTISIGDSPSFSFISLPSRMELSTCRP